MTFLNPIPVTPRFVHENTPGGIRVLIPAITNWYLVLGFPLFCVAGALLWEDPWNAGARAMTPEMWLIWVGTMGPLGIVLGLFIEFVPFLFFALAVVAWLYMSVCWLWTLFGREELLLRSNELEATQFLLGIKRKRSFPWDEITELRFRQDTGILPKSILHPTALLIEHGGCTHIYGRGLVWEEIHQIIAMMEKQMPQPVPTGGQMFATLP